MQLEPYLWVKENNQVLPFQARVELGAMAIKGYSEFPSITGTLPSDCLVSYLGLSLGAGVLALCRGAVGIFYSPSQLGKLF